MYDGLINLFKYSGLSSAAAVARVKRVLPRKTKVGHAGSLDPFATGVLIILIGKGTKSCERLMSSPKQYIAKIKLGAVTPSDDCDTEETPVPYTYVPSHEEVTHALHAQVGTILQRPPRFSALKVGGMRACDRVRMGETVDLPPRAVEIRAIELLDYAWPFATIKVDCGRGTYIRAIARDLGESLKVGGHLVELRRTRVGEYTEQTALRLEELDSQNIAARIIPLQ